MTIGFAVHPHGMPDAVAAFKHRDHAVSWANQFYHGRYRLKEIDWPAIGRSALDMAERIGDKPDREPQPED